MIGAANEIRGPFSRHLQRLRLAKVARQSARCFSRSVNHNGHQGGCVGHGNFQRLELRRTIVRMKPLASFSASRRAVNIALAVKRR
jgi:hypothetical protein